MRRAYVRFKDSGIPSFAAVWAAFLANHRNLVVKRFGPYSLPNLDVYYEDCVIGGPGAFLIPVHDMTQFSLAVRRKLLLEIAGLPPRTLPASETLPAQRMDCLIGEKLMERRLNR